MLPQIGMTCHNLTYIKKFKIILQAEKLGQLKKRISHSFTRCGDVN